MSFYTNGDVMRGREKRADMDNRQGISYNKRGGQALTRCEKYWRKKQQCNLYETLAMVCNKLGLWRGAS